MKKNIGIGYDNFSEIIEKNLYYVDKTLFIKDVINAGKVLLCTRPRRFGKTLNLSMVRYFYTNSQDFRPLFKGLAIENEPEFAQYAHKYPVISVSLKSVKKDTWEPAYAHLKDTFQTLYGIHQHLLESEVLTKDEKKQFQAILVGTASQNSYEKALFFLSKLLHNVYQQKVVILIDEYDTPIYPAYQNGYYRQMIDFLRSMMESALKDNPYLEKGLVTGILRIVKESLFSGINNLDVFSILSHHNISDKFGFTEEEVLQMLEYYEFSEEKINDAKSWYNSYIFGKFAIYNPWSVLNFASKPENHAQAYWVNTSDNILLRSLLLAGNASLRDEIQSLIEGSKLISKVSEELSFADLPNSKNAAISLLLSSGYLKAKKLPQAEENQLKALYEISIPNLEVKDVYYSTIQHWLGQDLKLSESQYTKMIHYLLKGEIQPFKKYFTHFLEQTVSIAPLNPPSGGTKGVAPDTEIFYHALILGMMAGVSHQYIIKSNQESGYGRYDICLIPKHFHTNQKGIVIEIKVADERQSLKSSLNEAEKQLKNNRYDAELQAHGITDIFRLCLAVKGKKYEVREVNS